MISLQDSETQQLLLQLHSQLHRAFMLTSKSTFVAQVQELWVAGPVVCNSTLCLSLTVMAQDRAKPSLPGFLLILLFYMFPAVPGSGRPETMNV